MEPATWITGSIAISVISVTIGKVWGANGKVTEKHCGEKQDSCQKLLIEKIDGVMKKVDDLSRLVNSKLLGL